MTTELRKAFEHVKQFHPTLSIVIIDVYGRWLYMDEDFGAFKFDDNINVSLLESGADSIQETPFIYQEITEE